MHAAGRAFTLAELVSVIQVYHPKKFFTMNTNIERRVQPISEVLRPAGLGPCAWLLKLDHHRRPCSISIT
jgi:hypothetical protein